MATVETVPELVAGETLTLEEFLRRWEAMPSLWRAELIEGVVYMPSPVGSEHGDHDVTAATCLGVYSWFTPGVKASANATFLMGPRSAPQPDVALRILPEYGGRVDLQGELNAGAPHFLVKTCASSAAYDLTVKKDLYERQGVEEYVAVLARAGEVRWHRLEGGRYVVLPPGPDGVIRSRVMPGLWLDVRALLAEDGPALLAKVQEGIDSPEHAEFVAELARRRADLAGGQESGQKK